MITLTSSYSYMYMHGLSHGYTEQLSSYVALAMFDKKLAKETLANRDKFAKLFYFLLYGIS